MYYAIDPAVHCSYRIQKLLAEAERDRLAQRASPSGGAADRTQGYARRVPILVLAALGLYLSIASVVAVPGMSARDAEAATVMSPAALTIPSAASCWVAGDLVGDNNPATIGATLCGYARQTFGPRQER